MEKRRWRTRLIVVAVLAVLVLVFGPKKLGWLVPGPDEAVTGYVMYELFSGSGAHDPAGEGLEELRRLAYEDLDAALLLGCELTIQDMEERGMPVHRNTLQARDYLKGRQE